MANVIRRRYTAARAPRGRGRRRLLVGIGTAVSALAALGSASLSGGSSNAGAATAAGLPGLRAQVVRGELLRAHGVRQTCPRCEGLVVTASRGSGTPLSTATPVGNGPADLARAYRLPTTTAGAHTTVAVIDAGVNPRLEADLAVYRRQYRLPACTTQNHCLRTLNYLGGRQPAPPTSKAGRSVNELVGIETSLDMDAVSAGCPSCRLLEISLPWQDAVDDNDVSTGDFASAVRTAVRAGATVISISYGYTADDHNTSSPYLGGRKRRGVVIVASSGDTGFNGGVHQSWPSNLPSVVAVGGTTLPTTGAETAWSGAGSGCETRFRAAAGQPAAVTALCGGHRAASDVAAVADPNTGLAVYDTYAPYSHQPPKWTVVGGTSASAPFIAGLFARTGDLARVDGPRTLYAAPAADFTDITSGQTDGQSCSQYLNVSPRLCRATRGWDGPTGLGSPRGLNAFRPSLHTGTIQLQGN